MAQAILEEDLNICHEIFASEVVIALNKFYSIPPDLASTPYETEYLSEGIYWGILTISFLQRENNHKVFKSLSKGLKNENYFYECCMFIPTERNDKFFFNFLKRVSRIYEMALFCYRNNNNYIDTARVCIAQFQDKEYFDSVGSWHRLDRVGSFLNFWSKRLRPVMLPEFHEQVETCQEGESKSEVPESKDTTEDLPSDVTCSIDEEKEYNSALVMLLADDCADISELGSIEDEIKSVVRYIKTFFPHRIVKCYKGLPEGPRSQNGSKEKLQTSSTGDKTSSTGDKTSSTRDKTSSTRDKTSSTRVEAGNNAKDETAKKKSETRALICERLAEEMASSLTEKMSLKAKCEELVRVIDETKACFLQSLDSSKSKLIHSSDSTKREENKTRYSSILEDDLYLSNSSNDDRFERLTVDKDCDEYKTSSGEDLHQTSDESTSESSLDSASLATCEPLSPEDAEYIKLLEHDLYVKAEKFMYSSFSGSDSDSDCTETYSTRNSVADEGDASAAQNYISSPENSESSSLNIKPKNKSKAKSVSRPLSIPAGSSAASRPLSIPAGSSAASRPLSISAGSSASNRPLSIPTESSAGAPIATEEDSDSSSDSNNEEHLSKPASSEAAEKPNTANANNEKTQQRKTKRRKKRGKSKK